MVAYADDHAESPSLHDLLQLAAEECVKTLLVDTYDKSRGSLLNVASLIWLREFSRQVHEARLALAIAGSLRQEDVAAVLSLQPEIVAVRTAACEGGREGTASAARVRELRQLLGVEPTASSRSSG